MVPESINPLDTPDLRKARGAFFTPEPIAQFIVDWAVRTADEVVFEPSAGDAQFLVEAVHRLRSFRADESWTPAVHGVEIHEHSAQVGAARVAAAGGDGRIEVDDFFALDARGTATAVIGNPPYVRFQDWSGEARTRSRAAALRAGVSLTGLASSWAAFVVQSAMFLAPGGRLGLVLPAELLSVNYAAPVRRFLFENFATVDIVLFDEQVFPEAEADVVLLLADGYTAGPASHMTIRQTRNADTLMQPHEHDKWTPTDPSGKWTGGGLVRQTAYATLNKVASEGQFDCLERWGDTTLGIVTGNNKFFTLSPARVRALGLHRDDLLRVSPPGSRHLRGLRLTDSDMRALGRAGKATWLFRPRVPLRDAAQGYVSAGSAAGVDQGYKCRTRKIWHQVPLVPPADLLLTCMNADTARLTTNETGAHHLNSVHGVYLREEVRDLGRELLPIASLNSITLLSAEIVGRAYGGGILKLEPKEADRWLMPSAALVSRRAEQLRTILPAVKERLLDFDLLGAVQLVDAALLLDSQELTEDDVQHARTAHAVLSTRRATRGKRGRTDREGQGVGDLRPDR